MCIRDRYETDQGTPDANFGAAVDGNYGFGDGCFNGTLDATCLLYTSDAADERSSVDLGGRRIIKKKRNIAHSLRSARSTPTLYVLSMIRDS